VDGHTKKIRIKASYRYLRWVLLRVLRRLITVMMDKQLVVVVVVVVVVVLVLVLMLLMMMVVIILKVVFPTTARVSGRRPGGLGFRAARALWRGPGVVVWWQTSGGRARDLGWCSSRVPVG